MATITLRAIGLAERDCDPVRLWLGSMDVDIVEPAPDAPDRLLDFTAGSYVYATGSTVHCADTIVQTLISPLGTTTITYCLDTEDGDGTGDSRLVTVVEHVTTGGLAVSRLSGDLYTIAVCAYDELVPRTILIAPDRARLGILALALDEGRQAPEPITYNVHYLVLAGLAVPAALLRVARDSGHVALIIDAPAYNAQLTISMHVCEYQQLADSIQDLLQEPN